MKDRTFKILKENEISLIMLALCDLVIAIGLLCGDSGRIQFIAYAVLFNITIPALLGWQVFRKEGKVPG